MKKLKPFDPIVVDEVRTRVRAKVDKLKRADNAATAILWFNQHAWEQAPLDVLKVSASLVAGSTQGADHAVMFVRRAAQAMAQSILDEAIRMASADLLANSGQDFDD